MTDKGENTVGDTKTEEFWNGKFFSRKQYGEKVTKFLEKVIHSVLTYFSQFQKMFYRRIITKSSDTFCSSCRESTPFCS